MVEKLTEDITCYGLLQGLILRPPLGAEGSETSKFEIQAGGRRLKVLSLLDKKERLAKIAPIPFIVRDTASEIHAEDDSLAETMQRLALHPLDQFSAFVVLRGNGQREKVIDAVFVVTRRLSDSG